MGSSSSSSVAPGELEQQDLEPRLLPAAEAVEPLLAGVGQLVAVEHAAGLLAAHAGAVRVAPVQDLQQGAPGQLGVLVGLHEPARPHPGAQLGRAPVRHRGDRGVADRPVLDVGVAATSGQQPQEVRLAGPVGAEHGHPLAVPDLEVEGAHQPGELEPLADHRALARAAALEPHRDLLLARLVDRRTFLLELAQPGLRGLVLGGEPVVVLRLHPVAQHQRLELGVLLVPAPAQLLEAREAVGARLVVRREVARVGPHGVAGGAELDGDHAGRGVGQQLAVVADEQHRLVGLAQPLLEPDLAGHVEEVVGLVEQQHLVGAGEQVLQHQPLLLPAAERRQVAVLGPVVGQGQGLDGAHVPRHLDVVAARVGVLGQRLGVAHLRALVVGLHQRQLAPVDLRGRGAHPRRRHAQQQVGDRRRLPEAQADHLPHHPQAAGAGHGAGVRHQVAGDDLQQRGLARAVGADQRDLGALADPERDVVEQHPPVRQLEAHPGDVHVSHETSLSVSRHADARRYCGRPDLGPALPVNR